jgi:hypothetical protein
VFFIVFLKIIEKRQNTQKAVDWFGDVAQSAKYI